MRGGEKMFQFAILLIIAGVGLLLIDNNKKN